MENIYHQS